MNKKDQEQFNLLQAQLAAQSQALEETNAQLAKVNSINMQLRQEWLRKEAQNKRNKGNLRGIELLRARFKELYFNDFRETAISIFEHENLPEIYANNFSSKRLERQIFNFGKVAFFKRYIKFIDADGQSINKNVPVVLPFTGIAGTPDTYGGFYVIRPYFANGGGGIQSTLDELTANVDCAIFTDFYEYSQTNANTSLSIKDALELYADILADIEVAKIQNRNFLKVPFIIDGGGISDNNEIKKLLAEVAEIVNGFKENADAILTKYANNIRLLNTGVVYYGEQFEQAKKDTINAAYNYLGIGNIKNENRARKITAEMEHTQDEYNINIVKRLQLRRDGWKVASGIYPEFKEVAVKVNLTAYNAAQEYLQQLTEGGSVAQQERIDRTIREAQ